MAAEGVLALEPVTGTPTFFTGAIRRRSDAHFLFPDPARLSEGRTPWGGARRWSSRAHTRRHRGRLWWETWETKVSAQVRGGFSLPTGVGNEVGNVGGKRGAEQI